MALTDLHSLSIPEVRITESDILSNLVFPASEAGSDEEVDADEGSDR